MSGACACTDLSRLDGAGGRAAQPLRATASGSIFTFLLPRAAAARSSARCSRKDVLPGVAFAQYFTAGIIASGVVYTAFQNLAITIPMERDAGTLKRLRGTPDAARPPTSCGKVGPGGGLLRLPR